MLNLVVTLLIIALIAAVFMLVVSTIGLRTGVLPRWLVIAGYIAGLVFLLSATYVELLVLLLPAWVIAVSIVILRAAPGERERIGERHLFAGLRR